MKEILAILRHHDTLNFPLENKDYHLNVLNNPLEGLLKIRKLEPKIIILDYATTRLNGLDCLDIIRSNPINHHIKIVFTTTSFNYSFFKKAFEMGADYFVKYPIKKEDIDKIINITSLEEEFYSFDNLSKTIELCKWCS